MGEAHAMQPTQPFRSLELSLCETRSHHQTSSHKDIIASAQLTNVSVAHSVEILNIPNIIQSLC